MSTRTPYLYDLHTREIRKQITNVKTEVILVTHSVSLLSFSLSFLPPCFFPLSTCDTLLYWPSVDTHNVTQWTKKTEQSPNNGRQQQKTEARRIWKRHFVHCCHKNGNNSTAKRCPATTAAKEQNPHNARYANAWAEQKTSWRQRRLPRLRRALSSSSSTRRATENRRVHTHPHTSHHHSHTRTHKHTHGQTHLYGRVQSGRSIIGMPPVNSQILTQKPIGGGREGSGGIPEMKTLAKATLNCLARPCRWVAELGIYTST